MTLEQLRRVCAKASDEIFEGFTTALEEFEINTPKRWNHFVSQIAHESGCFRYRRELASGDAYEGRANLGNTEPGDGRRFKGWGWMQTTGRRNTALVSNALFGDDRLVEQADTLINPPDLILCARSAGWFWTVGAGLNLNDRAIKHGLVPGCNLNDLADADDLQSITLAVNGGFNGLEERTAFYKRLEAVA